jgi:hypothetical protein
MDDFALLGLRDSTSLITNVQFVLRSKEVLIDCVYDTDERLPYRFVFYDCQEIKWNLLFPQGQRVSNPIDKRTYLISNQVGNKVALSGLG